VDLVHEKDGLRRRLGPTEDRSLPIYQVVNDTRLKEMIVSHWRPRTSGEGPVLADPTIPEKNTTTAPSIAGWGGPSAVAFRGQWLLTLPAPS